MGNETSMNADLLFSYVGQPWLTQYWVRQVYEKTDLSDSPYWGYGDTDEDQGILGSASALHAIGLLSARGTIGDPPTYEIAAPVFDTVTIHLNPKYYRGRTFTIVTHHNSPGNIYIQSAKLNGKPYNKCWIPVDALNDGALDLDLGPVPNKSWGIEDIPPSSE